MVMLLTDFIRNDGVFMCLTGKAPIKGADVNRVQRMMLSSVEVPHLLPLVIREIDDDVSLQYNITGKKMLSQCLRQDKLELTEFYSLLLQIVSVLEESKQYMLLPEQFYLDTDHIFVEELLSLGVLHFTYVPLKQVLCDEPLSQVLLKLVTQIMVCVDNINGDGIQRLLRWCSDERFTLAETRQLISELMTTGPGSQQVSGQQRESRFQVREYVGANGEQALLSQSPEWRRPEAPQWKMPRARRFFGEGEQEEHDEKEEGEGEKEQGDQWGKAQSSSMKTYLFLGAILAGAMLWKFVYLDHPGAGSLGISLIGTLLLAGGAFLVRRGFKLPGVKVGKHQKKERAEQEAENIDRMAAYRYSSDEMEQSLLRNWKRDEELETVQEKEHGYQEIEKEPLPGPISLPPKTVLLSRSGLDQEYKAAGASYSLERIIAGTTGGESIVLSKGSFVIGRSDEIAQYIDSTPGVSRAHIELMVKSSGCTLKDLGSRNGTVLGEEIMAPYKEYPLHPGDMFSIAESRYVLRVE